MHPVYVLLDNRKKAERVVKCLVPQGLIKYNYNIIKARH